MTSTTSMPDLLAAYRRDHTLQPGSFEQLRVAADSFSVWHRASYGQPPAVADLTKPNVHTWMDWAIGPPTSWAASTANSKRTALVSLANFAADAGLVRPLHKVKRFVEGTDPPTGWSLAEFDRILWSAGLEAADWDGVPAGDCWDFGFRMIWDSGARFSELWSAKTEHVDLAKQTWLVPASNRKGKRVGRLYELAEDTCEAIARTLDPDSPRRRLWPFPFGKRQVWVHWDRILTRAGLPANRRSKWHCIRRTAESYAAASKGKEWAAEAVGHSLKVAKQHYLIPSIVRTPSLSEALPRPNPQPVLSIVG